MDGHNSVFMHRKRNIPHLVFAMLHCNFLRRIFFSKSPFLTSDSGAPQATMAQYVREDAVFTNNDEEDVCQVRSVSVMGKKRV
jgi:hypothetical protein